MKCFQLSGKSRNRMSDRVFMAKLPLMPNHSLFEKQGKNIAILEDQEDQPLLLICDDEQFLERYREYYTQRFEMEEMPEDFKVPAEYEVVYGKVEFDNESNPEEAFSESDVEG